MLNKKNLAVLLVILALLVGFGFNALASSSHEPTHEKISNNSHNVTNADSNNKTSLDSHNETNTNSKEVSTSSQNEVSSNSNSATSAKYAGNKKTKVFHELGCSDVKKKMNPDNKVYFSSRQEAIDAGYRPCKHCNP
ncbi:MAG: hypothetical protein LBB45_09095 [Methanobrevibacter sp.]|jgi:hypothetical protein|nr:hypothetical protein [Candidatus Methanovirga basalitermitum]